MTHEGASRDYRDAVIEHQAAEIVELEHRLHDASAETESYRALAQEGIHALHDVIKERDQLRADRDRLLEENRARRARVQPSVSLPAWATS
jgi:hypothetical protein